MKYRVRADQSMTEAVVEAVSRHEDTAPLELPPLYDAVPTDALDALFDGSADRGAVSLSFTYTGTLVTIEDGERILIEPEPEIPVA